MPLTLLQIIQNAQNELGLPQATFVVGNPDPTTTQMLALTNRVLDEMRRMHPSGWSVCYREFNLVVNPPTTVTANVTNNSPIITITPALSPLFAIPISQQLYTVTGSNIPQAARAISVNSGFGSSTLTMNMEATGNATGTALLLTQDTYNYPTDWDWTQNRTQWDRSNRWELLGPDSPQMDQWHRSGIVATGPRRHWRKIGPFFAAGINSGGQFRLWPAPTEIANPLQFAMEYISTNCIGITGSNNAFANTFQNDTDVPLLDDAAITMGLKYRFWQIKGFNYLEMKNEWIDYVETLISRDEGAATLSLTKRVHPIFLSPANVQDGFFPGPVGPNSA